MPVGHQALEERGHAVERPLDVAYGAAGVPAFKFADKTLDSLVHGGFDGGVHIGKIVVEKRARAAGLLCYCRYREMGYPALGAYDAHCLKDSAAPLVSGQALGNRGRSCALARLGFVLLRGGIAWVVRCRAAGAHPLAAFLMFRPGDSLSSLEYC